MSASLSHSASHPVNPTLIGAFGLLVDRVKSVSEELRDAGIVARPKLTMAFSHTHRQFVLCADECGGAAENIGHYFGFLPLRADPTFFIKPVTLSVANTVHAEIAAASLISVEMFRYGSTYELAIYLHWLVKTKRRDGRPSHRQKRVFFGTRGILAQPLWQEGKRSQVGAYTPAFYSRAGDPLLIPEALLEAVGAITDAVCCINCRKSHILALNPVTLPEELRAVMAEQPVARRPEPQPGPAVDPRIAKARRNKRKNDRKKREKLLARQLGVDIVGCNEAPAVTITPEVTS